MKDDNYFYYGNLDSLNIEDNLDINNDIYLNDSIIREFMKLYYHKDSIKNLYKFYCNKDNPDFKHRMSIEELEDIKKNKDKKLDQTWEFLINNFSDDKINIFYLYYIERLKQKEIAEIMHVSQIYISLLMQKMVKKIRLYFLKKENESDQL